MLIILLISILLSIGIITIFLIADGYYILGIVVMYIGSFLVITGLNCLTIEQKSNNDINTRYEELTSKKIETEV